MRAVPSICLDLVHVFEVGPNGDFAATQYDDEGEACIGYGYRGPDVAAMKQPIDRATANALALQKLSEAAEDVCLELGPVSDLIYEGQYAALIDFVYNLGAGEFASSTLLRLIKAGDFSGAALEFGRWVYAKNAEGQEIEQPGLVRRRKIEAILFTLLT